MQIVDEALPGHHRKARNVVDRLLGIELGALPADLRQDVDEMAFDVEEPEFEHGEQAHGACADDDDVGFDIVGHELAPSRGPPKSTERRPLAMQRGARRLRSGSRGREGDLESVELGGPEDLAGQAGGRAASRRCRAGPPPRRWPGRAVASHSSLTKTWQVAHSQAPPQRPSMGRPQSRMISMTRQPSTPRGYDARRSRSVTWMTPMKRGFLKGDKVWRWRMGRDRAGYRAFGPIRQW